MPWRQKLLENAWCLFSYDIIHYTPFNHSHDIMYYIMTMIYYMRSYMISWVTKTTKIPDDSKSGLQRKCDSDCQRNLYFKTETLRMTRNPKLSLALQPDVSPSHGDRDPASVSQSRRWSESVTVTGSTLCWAVTR
jgi:hypothetical protein